MANNSETKIRRPLSAVSLIITTLIVIFFYVLFEWLFIATKPSFMTHLQFSEKLWILIYGILFFSTLSMIPVFAIMGVHNLINRKTHSSKSITIGFAVPATAATLMVFMLVDNFTYTLFGFGVISTRGLFRAIYATALLLIGVVLFKEVLRFGAWINRKIGEGERFNRSQMKLAVILLVIILVTLSVPLYHGYQNPDVLAASEYEPLEEDTPNILLFTIDGLNASHMSVYGYDRETTPFLEELSEDSLIALNAFSNAQGTAGSVTSILTGKDPMDTRVILADDILRGDDSYQHLPGILKNHGYLTYQLSFTSYADAIDINFLNAFDMANGRKGFTRGPQNDAALLLPTNHAYFNFEIITRLGDRLKHIFFIEQMENPFLQVTKPLTQFNDLEKMETLESLIASADQPVFVHFHWMGTHGPLYFPQDQTFSAGKDIEAQEKYDMDFYDDSIVEMDQALESLYADLEEESVKDRDTVLVIASDHSLRWTKSRLPLIIDFPDQEHGEIIEDNVQNMDIAPTLLDYLDIGQPDWMTGESLLGEVDPDRPIFTSVFSQKAVKEASGEEISEEVVESFKPFGKLSVLVCDTWYEIKLESAVMHSGKVVDYEGSCGDEALTRDEAMDLLFDHLQDNGFNTSELMNELTFE